MTGTTAGAGIAAGAEARSGTGIGDATKSAGNAPAAGLWIAPLHFAPPLLRMPCHADASAFNLPDGAHRFTGATAEVATSPSQRPASSSMLETQRQWQQQQQPVRIRSRPKSGPGSRNSRPGRSSRQRRRQRLLVRLWRRARLPSQQQSLLRTRRLLHQRMGMQMAMQRRQPGEACSVPLVNLRATAGSQLRGY